MRASFREVFRRGEPAIVITLKCRLDKTIAVNQRKRPVLIKIPHLILAAIMLAVAACALPPDNGAISVQLTDTPFPGGVVAEANVTISTLEMRATGEDEAAPYRIIYQGVRDYNLLELRNGLTANLGLAQVPPGSYDVLRLYVVSGQIVMKKGEIYNLIAPDGALAGNSVPIRPIIEIRAGFTSELLLDFDVSKSFTPILTADTISGFQFRPVFRAMNSFGIGHIAGSVSDIGTALLVDAEIWAEQDSIISSTFSANDGGYVLLGLLPGSYTVSATLIGYDTVSTMVNVVADSLAGADFDLTPQGD